MDEKRHRASGRLSPGAGCGVRRAPGWGGKDRRRARCSRLIRTTEREVKHRMMTVPLTTDDLEGSLLTTEGDVSDATGATEVL